MSKKSKKHGKSKKAAVAVMSESDPLDGGGDLVENPAVGDPPADVVADIAAEDAADGLPAEEVPAVVGDRDPGQWHVVEETLPSEAVPSSDVPAVKKLTVVGELVEAVRAVVAGQQPRSILEGPLARYDAAKSPAARVPGRSLKNAAILVLADAGEPLNAKAIVARAEAAGLYVRGAGLTPEATLAAGMLTDKHGRFERTAPGLFRLTEAGLAGVESIRAAYTSVA